jgi:hypothetical protein
MTAGQKRYLKCLGTAALIEAVVLVFTFYPLMESFMDHSAAASAQRSNLNQFLGLFGLIFHFPSILLAFWLPPLIPLVQIFLLGGLIYWFSNAVKETPGETSLKIT